MVFFSICDDFVKLGIYPLSSILSHFLYLHILTGSLVSSQTFLSYPKSLSIKFLKI